MVNLCKVLWLLLGCTTEAEPNDSGHDAKLTSVRPRRVTATVKREAPRLVRIATEHEVFITTPEHPFARLGSGWTVAGRLAPGDRVVSARFGAVRVVSVQTEELAQPTTVFNLSVEPSHTYLVGTDQVLVHNTGCADRQDLIAKKNEEIAREQARLAELRAKQPPSREIAAQITEVRKSPTLRSPRSAPPSSPLLWPRRGRHGVV